MTAHPARRASRLLVPRRASALLLCLLPLLGSSAWADAPHSAPQNSIRSLRTVRTGRRLITYNITVTSTAPFPMNDSVVTLRVGGREFINSSYGTDGTLNTLVFSLTRSEFQGLKSGAPVVVYYGQDNAANPAAQWNFGALDLGLLDRGAALAAPIRSATTGATPPMTAKTATAAAAKVAQKGHK